MKHFCFIIGLLISLTVGIVPWLIAPVSFITVLMSIAGGAMLVITIVQWARGGNCVFGNAATS